MAQMAMISAQVEIKSPADAFYGFFKEKLPQLPLLFPQLVKSFKFVEGTEVRDGAVICCEYFIGSPMTAKMKLEVDELSKSIKFIPMEGDLLKQYKSIHFKLEFQFGSIKIIIEFEKAGEASPNPDSYIEACSRVLKQLDASISLA
ncbi:hypothetical protein CDL15_Pgr020216 [Punica granatum]|uniref:Bet v I/Major latex protein domain-containing protein n=1 Tax=Punica granatum TaxID=22663 RepID=A0A218VSN3_PUNGR|nr:hypothetical protein CDL15_Pgr020216 [Punica granatum]